MISNLISDFVSPLPAGGVRENAPKISLYAFSVEEHIPRTQEHRQFRGPGRHSRTRVNDGDVLLTVARDLRGIREGIINRCASRDTLLRVDTLIDNLENYMAEN